MPRMLVVSHGRLAEELVQAAKTIVGDLDELEAVSINWDVDVTEAQKRLEGIVKREKDGVVILTDMFGGTPTNIALSLLEPGNVEVITGVNLPMLIKFTSLVDEADFPELARRIAEQGKRAIHVASELLHAGENPDAET